MKPPELQKAMQVSMVIGFWTKLVAARVRDVDTSLKAMVCSEISTLWQNLTYVKHPTDVQPAGRTAGIAGAAEVPCAWAF